MNHTLALGHRATIRSFSAVAVVLALLAGIGTVIYPVQAFSFILMLIAGLILLSNSNLTLIIAAITLPLSNFQLSLGGISIDLIEVVILIGLLQIAVRVSVYRLPLWLPPKYILIAAFAIPFISIGWSQDQAATIGIFPTILKTLLFMVFMSNLVGRQEDFSLFVQIYMMAGVVLAAITLIGPFIPFLTQITFRGMRVGYLLSSPNEYGDYLLTLLPYYLLALNRRGASNLIQLAVLLGAFVMTLSRGSWLGFAVSIVFLLFLGSSFIRQRIIALGIFGVLILATMQIGSWLESDGESSFYRLGERISSISELSQGELVSSSDYHRELLYSSGLELARQHPWLGMGEGIYQIWLSNLVGRPQNPHSVYLNILNSRGLIGLSLWLFMLVYWFAQLLKRYFTSGRKDLMALYIMTAMVGLITHQLVFDGTTPFYFWTVLALGTALTRKSDFQPLQVTDNSVDAASPGLPAHISAASGSTTA